MWIDLQFKRSKLIESFYLKEIVTTLLIGVVLFLISMAVHADWAVQHPKPQAAGLNAAWGFNASTIFAVGESGAIVRFDGSTWSEMVSPIDRSLIGVWGSSATNLYAVADDPNCKTQIIRYNGSSWQPISITHVANEGAVSFQPDQCLMSVWGTGAGNVYVLGWTDLFHYDGTSWRVVDLGAATIAQGKKAMWGSASNALVVVGKGDGASVNAKILHYNGTSWTDKSFSSSSALTVVSGFSASEIYAAGENGLVLRYNGSSWSDTLQSLSTNTVVSIWAAASNDVYIADLQGQVFRYNGSVWSNVTTDGPVSAIWGVSASNVYAFGAGGRIQNSTGGAFTLASGYSEATKNTLNGIWGVTVQQGGTGNEQYAVGDNGSILKYDGSAWTSMTSNTSEHLYDTWTNNPNEVYAAAGNGKLFRLDVASQTWSQFYSIGNINPIVAMWGSTNSVDGSQLANDFFVVSDKGGIYRYDGVTPWITVLASSTIAYRDVWGSLSFDGSNKSNDVFFVGDSGKIDYYNGTSLSPMTSGVTTAILRVWGSPSISGGKANDVYAVTANSVLHYNGSTWSQVDTSASGITSGFDNVWGTGAQNIFVSAAGNIIRFDGSQWALVAKAEISTVGKSRVDVWVKSPSEIYAVSANRIMRYQADNTAPKTFPVPENNFSFNSSAGSSALVELKCSDRGSSGCAQTYYTIGGTTPTTSSNVINNSALIDIGWGTNIQLNTFSVDNAGNTESVKSYTYNHIDSTVPVTTLQYAAGRYGPGYAEWSGWKTVTLTCTDTLSQCDKIYYTTNGSEPTSSSNYLDAVGSIALQVPGVTTIKYFSIDRAGNAETVQTAEYTIDDGSGNFGSNNGSGLDRGGPCFIATAAYGSYLDPHVVALRRFRDRYLLTNEPGRQFVAFYYKNSPPIAHYIGQHENVRTLTRFALTPLVLLVENPEFLLALVTMSIFLLAGRRRYYRVTAGPL